MLTGQGLDALETFRAEMKIKGSVITGSQLSSLKTLYNRLQVEMKAHSYLHWPNNVDSLPERFMLIADETSPQPRFEQPSDPGDESRAEKEALETPPGGAQGGQKESGKKKKNPKKKTADA